MSQRINTSNYRKLEKHIDWSSNKTRKRAIQNLKPGLFSRFSNGPVKSLGKIEYFGKEVLLVVVGQIEQLERTEGDRLVANVKARVQEAAQAACKVLTIVLVHVYLLLLLLAATGVNTRKHVAGGSIGLCREARAQLGGEVEHLSPGVCGGKVAVDAHVVAVAEQVLVRVLDAGAPLVVLAEHNAEAAVLDRSVPVARLQEPRPVVVLQRDRDVTRHKLDACYGNVATTASPILVKASGRCVRLARIRAARDVTGGIEGLEVVDEMCSGRKGGAHRC